MIYHHALATGFLRPVAAGIILLALIITIAAVPGAARRPHRQHEPSGNPAEPMTAVYPPSARGATRPDPEDPAQQAAVAVAAQPRPAAPAGAVWPYT